MKRKMSIMLVVMFCICVVCTLPVQAASKKKVKQIYLTGPYGMTMVTGQKIKLKVSDVKPKGASKAVKWESSNKKIAKVDQKGNIKAIKSGTVIITVKSKSNPKVKEKRTIQVVNKNDIVKIKIPMSDVIRGGERIKTGRTIGFRCIPCTRYGSLKYPVIAKWYSSNNSVATVDSQGIVKTIGPGEVIISAVFDKWQANFKFNVRTDAWEKDPFKGYFDETTNTLTLSGSGSNLNTFLVDYFYDMELKTDDVEHLVVNVYEINSYYETFYEYKNLKDVTFKERTSSGGLVSISRMFAECRSIETLDLDCLNVSKLKYATTPLKNCISLKTLNFKGLFEMENTELSKQIAKDIVMDCPNLERVNNMTVDEFKAYFGIE